MQLIVPESYAAVVRDRLGAVDDAVSVVAVDAHGHPSAAIDQAEALFRGDLGNAAYRQILAAAPKLRWIHVGSAGVERVLSPDLIERNITLTNSAGVYAIPIAEWVLHALLMIAKQGPQMIAAQQSQRWADDIDFDELGEKTLTILGIGGIGSEIAKRAAAFDMRVWGINRSGRSAPHVQRTISGDAWRDALAETDYLVVATPLTEATQHLIGTAELDRLPSHAWVINIARGAIIDEAALIARLQAGTLGGAALDTFEHEPLASDSPLWTLPNVIISPHHSGSSPRSEGRMIDLLIDNVQRRIRGDDLLNVVDQTAGY